MVGIARHAGWTFPPLWIGLVLLFALWWPLGLVGLAIYFGSRAMSCCTHGGRQWRGGWGADQRWRRAGRSSGNVAFDAYRDETLRRLEDDQRDFQDFLERLRRAKDQAQFDEFLADRERTRREDKPRDA
jgi:hypothetical protein